MVWMMVTLLSAMFLAGCSGHGFEGSYEAKVESSNEFLRSFAEQAGMSSAIVIGEDFVEVNGKRETFDDILVRESGGNRYLVFRKGAEEEVWEIVDDNTLKEGNGVIEVVMTRVN